MISILELKGNSFTFHTGWGKFTFRAWRVTSVWGLKGEFNYRSHWRGEVTFHTWNVNQSESWRVNSLIFRTWKVKATLELKGWFTNLSYWTQWIQSLFTQDSEFAVGIWKVNSVWVRKAGSSNHSHWRDDFRLHVNSMSKLAGELEYHLVHRKEWNHPSSFWDELKFGAERRNQ